MSPGYRIPDTSSPEYISEPPATPTQPQIPAVWNTFQNTTYGYQVDSPPGDKLKEQNTLQYGQTEFLGGCVVVYVIPHSTKTFSIENAGLTDKLITELELLPQGTAKTYTAPDWQGQKGYTYIVSYQKNAPRIISGIPWTSVLTTDNLENKTGHIIYFTRKNNDLYAIDTQANGSCPLYETELVVDSFKFLQ